MAAERLSGPVQPLHGAPHPGALRAGDGLRWALVRGGSEGCVCVPGCVEVWAADRDGEAGLW